MIQRLPNKHDLLAFALRIPQRIDSLFSQTRFQDVFEIFLAKQVQAIKIDPEAVSKEDVEMLQDLILAALNDAHKKVDEGLQQAMGGMMGGMKIPGL